MMDLPVSSIAALFLVVLIVPLSLRVSIRRVVVGVKLGGANKAVFGDGGDEILRNRIRAFGNAIEYAPIGLLVLALAESQQAPLAILYSSAALLVCGRYIHAIAMSAAPLMPPPRGLAMLMTYLALLLPVFWMVVTLAT